MFPARTVDGKVVLFEVGTGHALQRWPVDARELLATGAYTTDHASAIDSAVSVTARSESLTDGVTERLAAAASGPHVDTFVDEVMHDADALRHETEAPAGVDVPDPIATTRERKRR